MHLLHKLEVNIMKNLMYMEYNNNHNNMQNNMANTDLIFYLFVTYIFNIFISLLIPSIEKEKYHHIYLIFH